MQSYIMADIVYDMHGVLKKPTERFTVRNPPKVEIIEEKKKQHLETSVCLAIVKWVTTIIMFSLTLTSLVASKMSLISIGQRLLPVHINRAKTSKTCVGKDCESEVAFVMIILIMIIPNIISFLRALRNSAFSSTELWPSKLALFWGIIAAILEVIGLCSFTLILIANTKDFGRTVILMNGIFIFPIFIQIITEIRKWSRSSTTVELTDNSYISYESESLLRQSQGKPNHWKTMLLFVVSALCAAGGFGYNMYLAHSNIDRIVFLVSMICLSIAWSPRVFSYQSKPHAQEAVEYEGPHRNSQDEVLTNNIRIRTARYKMTLVSSFVKLVLTILLAFLVNYIFNITSFSNPGLSFIKGFGYFKNNKQMLAMFFLQICSAFLGYLMSWLACTMNLQKLCFALPLLLSTPVAVALSVTKACTVLNFFPCHHYSSDAWWQATILGFLLWLSQVLSWNFHLFKSQKFLMAREELLFWLPTYDGSLLEQFLLLNRKNEVTDEQFVNYHEIVKESHIYICTTMYHEADFEMEQLLHSLAKIDQARKECGRQFEAHIFFDDGARGDVVKLYALQLLSLLKETMGVEPSQAFKLETPYGLQLKWGLPNGMPFVLHLKDKVKVKSKKRWSQVMYMSYVLDFKQEKARDDLTYILATDADVRFTPNDVMALMDFMSRNPKVGAVCGRTHPLGSGPMVWYQVFDYAIGHWLLKVANHVYGSVLCSPGCFSVYRAKAIRDVLPLYASGVDCAMDFLMKDMGEDRWFCTLLVEAGWKLEYCATAENSTYCPDTFDEFFKQRRRWGPSTLANSLVVINEQSKIRDNNDAITFFFILYQMVLLVSSIIGPSTVLLVIAGGLQYAFPASINMVVVLILLIITTVLFTVVCLYCSQDTQLKVAKLLTFAFAVIMSITIVGIILQTKVDIGDYINPPTIKPSTTPPHYWHNGTTNAPHITVLHKKRLSTMFNPSTWYLLTITSIFILTAIFHGMEGTYLIHGVWYLLCLPSGYLLLTIYSIANLTDRSWGTREGKAQPQNVDSTWQEKLGKYVKYFCWCCIPPHLREKREENQNEQQEKVTTTNTETEEDSGSENESEEQSKEPEDSTDDPQQVAENITFAPAPKRSAMKKPPDSGIKRYPSIEELDHKTQHRSTQHRSSSGFRFPGQDKTVKFAPQLPRLHAATQVEEWLPKEYQCYVSNFKKQGYDNVAFIAGVMKEKDLINIGISNRGHRKKLMVAIDSLPPEELFQEVPENVEEWLIKLGLEEYWPKFLSNSYTEPRDLADIKYMSRDTIIASFNINKEAHLKRLLMATDVLQYPTKAQTRIREARKAIMAEPIKHLKTDNADDGEEFEFWEQLREICLLPEQAAFNQSGELVEKLGDLRDTALLVMTVSNVLWLTFMVTIMEQGDKLEVLDAPFASVAFLFVYGLVLVLQFISMLLHRLETGVHFLARAPFKPGHFKSNWAWRDQDLPPPPDAELLDRIRRKKRRISNASSHSDDIRNSMDEPLLRQRSNTFNT